jgi:hypothetical protein
VTPRRHPSVSPCRWAARSISGTEQQSRALSQQLERWLEGEGERTLGSLIAAFDERSLAILFVLVLRVPALPLQTDGATHLFDAILGRFQAAGLEYSADPVVRRTHSCRRSPSMPSGFSTL